MIRDQGAGFREPCACRSTACARPLARPLTAPPCLCRVDCPLSKVPSDLVAKHEGLVLAALEALQPVARLWDVVARWATHGDI